MFTIHRRILIYAAQHGKHPESLKQLPVLKGFMNETKDAWHYEIEYHLVGDNLVELISRGEDGKVGGTGNNEDIIRRFTLRDKEGDWMSPISDWLPTKPPKEEN